MINIIFRNVKLLVHFIVNFISYILFVFVCYKWTFIFCIQNVKNRIVWIIFLFSVRFLFFYFVVIWFGWKFSILHMTFGFLRRHLLFCTFKIRKNKKPNKITKEKKMESKRKVSFVLLYLLYRISIYFFQLFVLLYPCLIPFVLFHVSIASAFRIHKTFGRVAVIVVAGFSHCSNHTRSHTNTHSENLSLYGEMRTSLLYNINNVMYNIF